MREEQRVTTKSQVEGQPSDRLMVLRKVAYGTMKATATMDEPGIYTGLAGRGEGYKPERGTMQSAIDRVRLLNTVANRGGVREFLGGGGVIPVVRGLEATGGIYSLILAGDLSDGGEEGKVGVTIVMDSWAKDNINPKDLPRIKLNDEWVSMVWGKVKKDNVLSYAHQMVRELAKRKPKSLLYDLVEALK